MISKSLVVLATLAMVLVVGCKKDDGPGASNPTDEDALLAAVSQDTIGSFSNSEEFALDDGGLQNMEYFEGSGFSKIGQVDTAMVPLRWGRQVQIVDRHVAVQRLPGDTLAVATITKTVTGILHILAVRDSAGVPDTVHVTKAFSDTARRKVLFARIRRTEDPRRNWLPVAITLLEGHSPADNFTIDSVEVMTPRDTVTVTDPLNTWLRLRLLVGRDRLMHIRPTDSVRVRMTITSQNDSSEFVALRWGIGWNDGRRFRARVGLISQSGGPGSWTRVYGRTFRAHPRLGLFNAVIDALSYNTLFDNVAPYSNKFWGKPYISTLL